MGLIAARPEEPDEWMGIPSEPRDIDTGVDRLVDPPTASPDAFGLFGGGTIESISIPTDPPVDSTHQADTDEDLPHR